MNLARVKMRRGITSMAIIGETVSGDEAPTPPDVTDITERVAAAVNEIIGPKYTAPGAVDGVLQAINSRGTLYFTIYDSVFGSRVQCDIPDRLKGDALAAFDERVLVSGLVARDAEGHPRHVKAERIERLGALELPQSIRGLDPDFTGPLSSSEYVKRSWSA
jgi:hypothetical protein